MRHVLKMSLVAVVVLAVANALAASPSAPGSFANCEVLSYTTNAVAAKPAASGLPAKRTRLLSSSSGGESVETWVVRSAANSNQTYAVRRTLRASGEISMCAYTPNRVLATLVAGKSYATFVQEMAAKGLTVVRELMRDLDGNAVYVIEAAETENDIVEQMTMSIESTGSCSLVRPDHIYEANAVPNDTYYSSQWALEKIGAPQAWDTRTDASSVLVAVLDTGVNYNHYDLNRSMWINEDEILGDGIDNDGNGFVDDIYGMSCIGGNVSGDSMDDNGHGSHCAGIIGAAGNNRQWISGVAWRAKIMGLKFLNSEGKGSVSDAITCLCYAEAKGVKVINCSFGSTDWDDYLYIQMKKMSQQGTIFVCAAGNAEPGLSPRDNDEYPFYPCNYSVDTLVSVAATDSNDALANFSYYGAQNVDIAAPGVNINSTVLGTYGLDYKDGTSMATPHVTGALALLMAHYPGETSLQLIDRLYAAAEPIPALAGRVRTGARLSMAGFFGIPAPVEISVTQGSIADAVVVYWTAVDGGTHYRLWRAGEEGGEKTMLCDWQQGLTFSDETAEPGVTYWYYLQAASSIDGASASTYSIGVSGFRPEIDTSRITVTFNPNGGTVNPPSKVYRVGETYDAMPVPTYSGKAFLGWFTETDGGTRLGEPSIVRAEATTLYAHWVASDALRVENLFARQRYPWNGYVDITFNLFGVPEDDTASVTLTAQEEGVGSPLALRTFVGPAPTNLMNGAQHVVWNATPDTQGILYTNMILSATIAIDEKPLLPPENVQATDGSDSNAVVVTWSASANATSYEVWRATANNSMTATLIASPTATSYSDATAVPATNYWYWVKAVNAKKTSEFSASASGSRKRVATGIVISGPASVTADDTATYVCTATYNDNTTAGVAPEWSIEGSAPYATINSSTGVLTANGTATQSSVTVKASYSYNGSMQTMTKSVTIDTKSVTISFNANGGSVSPTSQPYTAYGTYGSLPTPTYTGYTFAGWWTESSGGMQVTASSTVSASNTTLWAHWTANVTDSHDKVQLWEGGPYWATTNIGAENPEDYGYYFWWGDTIGYKRVGDAWVASDGSSSNFSFSEANAPTYGKDIATLQSEGWITADGALAPEHDAAHVQWGGGWRMPTNQELNDLSSKCDWTWTTMNGVNGYVVRGKGAYASNSIFLPAAGNASGNSGSYGYYWSSRPFSGNIYYAIFLNFVSSDHGTAYEVRYCGYSARPVQGTVYVAPTLADAVDNTALTFTTGGSSLWVGQSTYSHDGVDAARSGTLGNSKTNWLQTTVSGAGSISFWWYASSEANYDYLEFLVDGTLKSSISGTNNVWTLKSFDIGTSGTHTLTWRYRKDGSVDKGLDAGFVDQVVWTGNGGVHDKVQLWEGGPYWATTNIGAEDPEDYGYYFWWGDTIGYKREGNAWVASDGSSSNFSFNESNTPTYNKSIATLQSEGWITADNVLVPEHDAAQVQWGGDWRMPTSQELNDLISKCDWTRTMMNGVNGYVVRGCGVYAANSIFLPFAGYGYGTSLDGSGEHGYSWSSFSGSGVSTGDGLTFNLNGYGTNYIVFRDDGLSIRPVQGNAADALYLVVDLSGGASAVRYPVTYMAAPPSGGFNTDEYKTTKLVLRRIEPGSFKMSGWRDVTITKPFYCGIFEVTQRQYELVTGSRPSYFKNAQCYATRPVENVSWETARGNPSVYNWPSSRSPAPSSFIGKIQAKTGLSLDLPTEAQWEYACHAGTTGEFNNGQSGESAMASLGRYMDNSGAESTVYDTWTDDKGTAKVGSYQPNNWGLYDMHGNVLEWCLDWAEDLQWGLGDDIQDPEGPLYGSQKIARGGNFSSPAASCSAYNRWYMDPLQASYPCPDEGFRLVGNLSEE